jgi:tungstate transport system substrate-binding protein
LYGRIRLLLAILFLGLAGVASAQGDLLLATTTSTQDTGLLDVLLPRFQALTGIRVKTLAVGSGQALALGRKGEADVLLVHSPEAEKAFVAEGAVLRRRLVMHNDFVLVGPDSDPAGLRGSRGAVEAFRRLAKGVAPFVSRGDQSGTHAQERRLWAAAGVDPAGRPWYLETGTGMGQTLSVASERRGCALTDRGTFLAMRKVLALAVLVEGDPALANVYHVIELDPRRFPKIHAAAAKAFADFLVSPGAQECIRTFGADRYGTPLFQPDAGKKDD